MTRHAHHHGTTDAPSSPAPVDTTDALGSPDALGTTGASSTTGGISGKRPRAALLLAGAVLAITPGLAAAEETGVSGVERTTPPRAEYACERGEFCLWTEQDYDGTIIRLDLRNTNPEECRPLPKGVKAHAFANRIDRHVTVYQDRNCSTEGDFSTFPGPDTFVPQSPYVVRAVQIWD